MCRISDLEETVSTLQDRMGQLQVEKDKALTDLIAIRKINSSMEKSVTHHSKLVHFMFMI